MVNGTITAISTVFLLAQLASQPAELFIYSV